MVTDDNLKSTDPSIASAAELARERFGALQSWLIEGYMGQGLMLVLPDDRPVPTTLALWHVSRDAGLPFDVDYMSETELAGMGGIRGLFISGEPARIA